MASRVRFEEKALLRELVSRHVAHAFVDTRTLTLPPRETLCTTVLVREISQTRAICAAAGYQAAGTLTINRATAIEVCGDKAATSSALVAADVPTPRWAVALTPAAALFALEDIGFPAVLKPLSGSWGRLVTRVRDRAEAEAVLEHREHLKLPSEQIVYVQEYIEAGGRDLRAVVVGDEVVSLVARTGQGWRANAARGAVCRPVRNDAAMGLACRAAAATAGDIVGVDLLEDTDGRLLVNEVNGIPEFHAAAEATGVNIAASIVDFVGRFSR